MDRRRRLLYGRSPAVSRQLCLLSVGLFALTAATFYTDVNTLWPFPLAVSGALLLVGLAGVEAYYNDGVLVVWLSTFAASLPAFVFYPPRGPLFAVTSGTAPVAVATALMVAGVLGVVGFAVGAVLRRQRDGHADYVPSPTALPAAFVGRDGRLVVRWSLLAVGEFAVLFAGVWTGVLPFGFGLGGPVGLTVLLLLMGGPAALYAARNGGLLVCWLLAFAPLFGVFLALQLGGSIEPAPTSPALFALGAAVLYAVPVGTVGFLLGLLERWVSRRLWSPPEPSVSLE